MSYLEIVAKILLEIVEKDEVVVNDTDEFQAEELLHYVEIILTGQKCAYEITYGLECAVIRIY